MSEHTMTEIQEALRDDEGELHDVRANIAKQMQPHYERMHEIARQQKARGTWGTTAHYRALMSGGLDN